MPKALELAHREAQAIGRVVTAARRVADDHRNRPSGWIHTGSRKRLAELVAAVDNLDAVRASAHVVRTAEEDR